MEKDCDLVVEFLMAVLLMVLIVFGSSCGAVVMDLALNGAR